MMKLKDKVALITGAGSGIGKSTAILFAKEGANVVVADINENTGLEVVKQIMDDGGEGTFVQVDVSHPIDNAHMVRKAIDSYGRLDVLFNNAGVLGEVLEDITEEKWRRLIDVVLTGPFFACTYAIPIMRRQGSGNILNTGSIWGLTGGGRSPAYNAAKAGLVMLTRFLARNLAKDNIRVNCICPGPVDTPIPVPRQGYPTSEEERRATQATRFSYVPMGRPAKPEEIASVALFLASDDSSFITGVALPVDGGTLA